MEQESLFKFTIAGVAMLLAGGVAWGTLRATVLAVREGLAKLESWTRGEFADLRKEIRAVDEEQRTLRSRFDRARGREEGRAGLKPEETKS